MSAGLSGLALGLIGAGVVGGAATIIGGSEAANATTSSTNAAINAQNQALSSQQALSAPYQQIGTTGGAISQYENLLGLGPSGGAGVQSALAATPGYQFAQQQGLQSTEAAAAASGLGLSGNTLQGLDQFSTGLADQTYQQAVGNAQNAVGIGQAAAAGQAANIGNAANNVSSDIINQGNTLAGIDANTAAGISKTAGNVSNNLITANTLAGLISPSNAAAAGAG